MRKTLPILCLVLLAAVTVLIVGCDVDSASSPSEAEIIVTPNYVELRKGQSAQFVATGWHEYTWSLHHTDWGVLSRQKGDRTVYTRTSSTNGMQTLTVTATETSTNETFTSTSEVLIYHN